MHLEPPRHKPRALGIREIRVIRTHDIHKVRVGPDTEVVLEIAEDDLHHRIAVCLAGRLEAGVCGVQQEASMSSVVLLVLLASGGHDGSS